MGSCQPLVYEHFSSLRYRYYISLLICIVFTITQSLYSPRMAKGTTSIYTTGHLTSRADAIARKKMIDLRGRGGGGFKRARQWCRRGSTIKSRWTASKAKNLRGRSPHWVTSRYHTRTTPSLPLHTARLREGSQPAALCCAVVCC